MSFNLYHNLPELARKGGFTLFDGADEKDDSIDWRFIASIDTSRIIRDSDFEKLDQCIPFLIRSSVGNLLNVRILDPAIARIYIISQLCLQYLLFCTKFLDKSVYSLRENIFTNQKKFLKLEETIEQKVEEIAQLQKKLKRYEALNQNIFSCTKCTKNFLSSALLDNHALRKHPKSQLQESRDKDSNLINTIKLELEIKQLKERLNVTEKELTGATQKMECEKCSQNAQRKFENVGIQSNFEEKEKDDIEKDAIAELLNNQMKHFEDWKRNEESRYRDEICELRSKLDETIEVIKQGNQKETPAPLPAPRTLTLSEKAFETSKSIESLPEANENENVDVWKSRYEELEKMYEQHQAKMISTVTSIETIYRDKFSQLEDSVKLLKEEKIKAQEMSVTKSDQLPKVPLSPRIVASRFVQDSSSESSDDALDSEPVKIKNPKTQKPKIDQQLKPEIQSFSEQKFALRQKPQKEKLPKRSQERGSVKLRFGARLNEFGIKEKDQRMTQREFDKVQLQLADNREKSKQKNKNFFITRKKLLARVDEIFHRKNETNEHKVVGEKQKIKTFTGNTSKLNVAESAEPAELFKVSESIEPNETKKTFRDDLERILERRVASKLYSEPEDPAPLPASKKKVLFDLDNLNDSKFDEVIVSKPEDSDFDISSFASEFEEIKS